MLSIRGGKYREKLAVRCAIKSVALKRISYGYQYLAIEASLTNLVDSTIIIYSYRQVKNIIVRSFFSVSRCAQTGLGEQRREKRGESGQRRGKEEERRG